MSANDKSQRDEVRKSENAEWSLLGVPYMSTGVLYTQHFADRSPLWQGKCFKRSAELLMETVLHNWHIFPTKMSTAEKQGEVFEKNLSLDLWFALCCCTQRAKKFYTATSDLNRYIDFLNRAKLPKVLASLSRHRKRLRSAPVVSGCQAGGVEESAFYLLLQTKVNYVN